MPKRKKNSKKCKSKSSDSGLRFTLVGGDESRIYKAGSARQAAKKAWREMKWSSTITVRERKSGELFSFDTSDFTLSAEKKPFKRDRPRGRDRSSVWE